MKIKKNSSLASAALVYVVVALALPASAGTYVTFDVPGANGAAIPYGVNKWGAVAGYYLDIEFNAHGFLFQPGGKLTTFSVKTPKVSGTYPTAINDSGWIVGYCYDGTGMHGFLRNPNYTLLDAPGAGTNFGQGTQALSINDAGEIAGIYFDSSSVEHGFVRDASGVYTSFDVPGGTGVASTFVNGSGTVAGTYNDKTSGGIDTYGYVMDTSGNITTFNVPGAAYGAIVTGINSAGSVTGAYYPTSIEIGEYVRDQYGNITSTLIPGFILSAGIEDSGTAVGTYQVANSNTQRGWQVNSTGAVSYFKDPSAGSQGTRPTCVSGNGHIAGYYYDAQGNPHDFVESN